ncbi:MAG: hypothetical protein KBE38_14615 [Ignavibacterium sp.]|nr:hypothetical protein [Ignavibacterium sp.]
MALTESDLVGLEEFLGDKIAFKIIRDDIINCMEWEIGIDKNIVIGMQKYNKIKTSQYIDNMVEKFYTEIGQLENHYSKLTSKDFDAGYYAGKIQAIRDFIVAFKGIKE